MSDIINKEAIKYITDTYLNQTFYLSYNYVPYGCNPYELICSKTYTPIHFKNNPTYVLIDITDIIIKSHRVILYAKIIYSPILPVINKKIIFEYDEKHLKKNIEKINPLGKLIIIDGIYKDLSICYNDYITIYELFSEHLFEDDDSPFYKVGYILPITNKYVNNLLINSKNK